MKNRTETEQRLIDAVTSVMVESGISGIGVNRVAEKAGCSKMLIYRYFGDFDGLIQRWAEDNNYWIKKVGGMDELLKNRMSLQQKRETAISVLTDQIDEIRSSAVMRELLRWQISSGNKICKKIMEKAEEQGLMLTNALAEGTSTEIDIHATIAVITSGIYYLALQADYAPVYNGVSLETEEGWSRIKKSVGELMEMIFRTELMEMIFRTMEDNNEK